MRCGGSSSSHARTSLARSSMRPRMGYTCCRGYASSGCRAWLTSRFGSQPARAHFDPRAHSKPLIRTTGAPRLRTSSTPIRWRRSYARLWPTKRNGGEAHPIFCRSAPTGLAGQRVHAHSLAGYAGRRASSAHSGLKLSSVARAGWECVQSGSWPRMRTDSITSSAPSAASATMEMARVQTILGPDWNRRFNCADDADDADDTDAKELEPFRTLDPGLSLSRVLLPADFGRWHTESARRFASPQRAFTGMPRDNGSSKR